LNLYLYLPAGRRELMCLPATVMRMSNLQNFVPISSGGISLFSITKPSMLINGIDSNAATSLCNKSGYRTNSILNKISDLNVYCNFVSFLVFLAIFVPPNFRNVLHCKIIPQKITGVKKIFLTPVIHYDSIFSLGTGLAWALCFKKNWAKQFSNFAIKQSDLRHMEFSCFPN